MRSFPPVSLNIHSALFQVRASQMARASLRDHMWKGHGHCGALARSRLQMDGTMQGRGHEIIHHGHAQTSASPAPTGSTKGINNMRYILWRNTTAIVAYCEEKVRCLVIGRAVKGHRDLASDASGIGVAFHIGQEIEQDA